MVHLLCACRPGLQFVSTLDLPHPAAPCMPVAALPYVEALFTLCLFRRALWLQVALRKVGAQPGWLGGRVFPLPAVGGGLVACECAARLRSCLLAFRSPEPTIPPTHSPAADPEEVRQAEGRAARPRLPAAVLAHARRRRLPALTAAGRCAALAELRKRSNGSDVLCLLHLDLLWPCPCFGQPSPGASRRPSSQPALYVTHAVPRCASRAELKAIQDVLQEQRIQPEDLQLCEVRAVVTLRLRLG